MVGDVSLWIVLPVMFLGMFATCLLGQFINRRLRAGAAGDDDGDTLDGVVVSGVFGLMALLMAFSFSLAIGRFEERRADVVEEANAIGTMYSRLALLPAEPRVALERELAAYTRARAEWGDTQTIAAMEQATAQTEAMGDRFGEHLFAAINAVPPDPRVGPVVSAYNAMSDAATTRHAVRSAHLPGGVTLLLVIFLFGASLVLGFTTRNGRPHSQIGSALLLALLAMAFCSILDLDRPARGTFQVPQTEMLRLADKLQG